MGVVHSLLWAMQGLDPRGYPNSKVLGPKIHTLSGLWDFQTLLFGHLDFKP